MNADESLNNNESPDAVELTARISSAFETMPVPPGPSVRETVALLAGESEPGAPHVGIRSIVHAGAGAGAGGAAAAQPIERRATLSRRGRWALGGLGLSTAAGLLLMLFLLDAGQPLSAMERMARELQQIHSYSYKVASQISFYDDGQREPTIVSEEGVAYWQAPDAFHDETKITRLQVGGDGKHTEEVVVDFAQVFPTGKLGLFIDHLARTYRWLPNEPYGSATFPWETLRLIRENSGEIIQELGKKEVAGREARGYVIVLKGWRGQRPADQVRDPIEVWVDAATDLPLEFSYRGKHDEPDQQGAGYWMRATDFRWNIDVDAGHFEPHPPAGYTDIGPPEREEDLQKIVDALSLYAELSGGHYPRVEKFDAAAVHDEMLKLAGFTGQQHPEWKDDPKYRRIEQVTAGLKWIETILRNRFHSGYEGQKVGPTDKDKPLLWWTTFGPEQYEVIYGDLRREALSAVVGKKLGLGWVAAAEEETPDESH